MNAELYDDYVCYLLIAVLSLYVLTVASFCLGRI